jgi:hypothetical protein
LIFESNSYIIFLGILVALVYSWLLYSSGGPWSKNIRYALAACRFMLVFIIIFLLAGPILKQWQYNSEKPGIVFAIDNSSSLAEVLDSVTLVNHRKAINELANKLEDSGFDISFRSFGENNQTYNYPSSDLHGLLKNISNEFEGKNVKAVLLASDGVYNSGLSPLYTSFIFPVYTLGIGDTTMRTDLAIKNVSYNKISYQGNRFPVKVEVTVAGYARKPVKVDIYQSNRLIETQQQNSADLGLLEFNFLLDADKQGVQQYSIRVTEAPDEFNTRNNYKSIFIDVVEGRKKILLIAPAPHPDIKALRSIVESNSNYEFLVHIPRVMELPLNQITPPAIDLVIFHQSPDRNNITTSLYNEFIKAGKPRLLLMGRQLNSRLISTAHWPIGFEGLAVQWDEVTPVLNTAFDQFLLSTEMERTIRFYPPVTVPISKYDLSNDARVLLSQRIGSLETERPLLVVNTEGARTAVVMGEGIWRWPLQEHARSAASTYFNELFSKLIQYLSSQDDKRKFRFYPLQNEFSDTGPVIFESEAYNDLYERIYGNPIRIEISNEAGQKNEYDFTPQAGTSRYQLGGLAEGAYTFRATSNLSGKQEIVDGRFVIVAQNIEQQNLVADFDLLRKLSANTGAEFYSINDINTLETQLTKQLDARPILRAEENFLPFINLKWLFFIGLLLISLEWFARKYFGSY